MSQSFEFSNADHFTIGTVGEPGRRVFLIQFTQDRTTATFKVEKQQVAALCVFLGDLLDDAPSPGHLPEDLALRTPIEIDWTVASLAATYDEVADKVVFHLGESVSDETTGLLGGILDSDEATARCSVTREQAAAVAIHGTSLVESGRPPCPLCGHPLDPAGHACPRTNGYRPPEM